MRRKRLLVITLLFFLNVTFVKVSSQVLFKYGFGGGINFANIIELQSYPLYEDINGNIYSSTYSGMFNNVGSQFFFHGEAWFNNLIVAIKPGSYTYKFSKADIIEFNTRNIEQQNEYLVRYLEIPIEMKTFLEVASFTPFIGGGVSYGHLLQQGGEATNSFIRPKISVTPLIGTYYSFTNFDLVLTAGYNFTLHSVTKNADRYNTGSSVAYSQSNIRLNNMHVSLSILFSLLQNEAKGALDCPTPSKGGKAKSKKINRK